MKEKKQSKKTEKYPKWKCVCSECGKVTTSGHNASGSTCPDSQTSKKCPGIMSCVQVEK